MSFSKFVKESMDLVSAAIESMGYSSFGEIEWAEPREKEYGDLSFRVGFQLAKQANKRPDEISGEIAKKANSLLSTKKYIESIEAHPSGFLNIRIRDDNFLTDVLREAAKQGYGKIELGNKKEIIVEHTSANPNKALHVGHLRNTAIGDSLARIFSFASYKTKVLNYIDDSGLQVADVIVGMKYLGFPEEAPKGKKYDHYAGDPVYIEVTRKYEEDITLKEKQTLVLKQIEEHDPDIIDFVFRVTDNILKEQLKTCWRFGASYDLLVYESDIIATKLWDDLFSELKEKGIAKFETEGKLAGCWIVTLKGETEGEDKVLVRSNGTATYIAKDTPFAALKMGLIKDKFSYEKYVTQPDGRVLYRTRSENIGSEEPPVIWKPEKSLTPIDNRQARLQRIIQYMLSELANENLSQKYVHVGYEIVSLSSKTAATLGKQESAVDKKIVTMAGRKGLFVNADDAMDALKQRAIEETAKRNPDNKDTTWLDSVAEKIAISALRFSLLKQDLEKIIIFDMDDSLKMIGETGPYLLYTYARASSIIAKLDGTRTGESVGGDSHFAKMEQNEIDLLKLISKFDLAIEKSVKMIAPKWIAHYSFNLCEAFNKFYESNRVLQEPDQQKRKQRIMLVEATRSVLRESLGLLGIEVLEKI